MVYISPVVGEWNATFPWVVELCFRNGALWCLVVLVWTVNSTVNHDDTWLIATSHLCDAWHVDVLIVFFAYPATIHPKDVNLTIARENLVHLIVCELFVRIPTPRPFLDVVVYITTSLCWIHIPPIVL